MQQPEEHPSAAEAQFDRRTAIGVGIAWAGAGYLISRIPDLAEDSGRLPDGAPRLLSTLSTLVLPQTDTSRAGAPADVDFIMRSLRNGFLGAKLWMLHKVATLLDTRTRLPFLNLPAERQMIVLRQFDAEVFAHEIDDTGWPTVKALLLAAYYSSEEGATRELQYELVPGRFAPDIVVTPATRAYASEWLATRPVHIEMT